MPSAGTRPTCRRAGDDGTEVVVEFLGRAGEYLAPGGAIYFPIAVDLSPGDLILAAANARFDSVVNVIPRGVANFPVTDAEIQAIDEAYGGDSPEYVNIQSGQRPFWRGQIFRAMNPR